MSSDYSHGYDNQTDAELLEKVKKGWRSKETPCGSGSEIANTRNVSELIPRVMVQHDLQTLADVGAGDLNWMDKVRGKIPEYYAFDLFPRHPLVYQHDITKAPLPHGKYDIVLCRHVLNHLSIEKAEQAINNIRLSATYLLMTNNDNQRAYWKHFDFQPFTANSRMVRTWHDCQTWDMEMYRL